jgi:hypothetical protein
MATRDVSVVVSLLFDSVEFSQLFYGVVRKWERKGMVVQPTE